MRAMQTQTLELPVLLPGGPECERCVGRLQSELARLRGVAGAAVNRAKATISISYDPNVVTIDRIEHEARRIGTEIASRVEHETLDLKDLDCPDCAASIEKAVNRMPGIVWAGANFPAAQMYVEFERAKTSVPEICKVVEGHGIRACPIAMHAPAAGQAQARPAVWLRDNRKLVSTAASILLTALAVASRAAHPLSIALYAAAIVAGGWTTARGAWMAARARGIDMNVLMTLAVIGAAGIGDWFEAATVVALYNVGNLLQAQTMERTRRSIRRLMEMSPKTARVLRDGQTLESPVEEVRVEDVVLVKPGERIPMDGEVRAGSSAVNQAPITGESVPVQKSAGDTAFAGTLNGVGSLEIRVTRLFRDTTLARIVHQVEEAQARRAPAQQLVDRFARWYTPAVVALAALIAVAPPLLAPALHLGAAGWSAWFTRALSLLIIACPCALIISTPVAIVTAIGSASRNGALIKGGAYLEELGRLRALLYDKTGTLTEGRFRIFEIVPLRGATEADVLRIAAALESKSEHPLAEAFIDEASRRHLGRLPAIESFEALPGVGVRGRINGVEYVLGNRRLAAGGQMIVDGASARLESVESEGLTSVVLAREGRPIGLIALADSPREEAASAVRTLASLGIAPQAMVTGDNAQAAERVAKAVGLAGVQAGLLPEEKLRVVKEYQAQFGVVGMVGDGVNDAPALAAANVGIVMGAAGSDTAIETADVALMADDLTRLPYLIRLSRRTRAIILQNVGFSLLTKAVLVIAAVTIGLPLWLAVLGDVGVSLLVTLNALRLLERRPSPSSAT